MSALNVLIVTNQISEYRVPLYNALSKAGEFRLSIVHCGDLVSAHQSVAFHERICTSVKLGKITLQRNIQREAEAADVIIVMFDLWWLMSMWLAIRWPEKVILWGHGFGRNKIFNYLRVGLAKHACGLLVYEEPAARKFIERGISAEKVFVAGNTIEVKNYGRSSQKRDRFLFVGRLQERKRVDVFIKAFSRIKDRLPENVGIIIVGGGAIQSQLEQLVMESGLAGRVEFLGEIREESILKQCFDRAIAYVSPGAVGLSVLHSFAYGVPVITDANIVHGPEIVNVRDRETGVLYSEGDQELSELLVKFATDVDLSESFGVAAYQHYRASRLMPHMVERMLKAIAYVHEKKLAKLSRLV